MIEQNMLKVHPRPRPPLSHFPATCSSACLSVLAAFHFLSQPLNVCSALVEVEVADVPSNVRPLPVVRLGHRFPGPAKLINGNSFYEFLLRVQFSGSLSKWCVCVFTVLNFLIVCAYVKRGGDIFGTAPFCLFPGQQSFACSQQHRHLLTYASSQSANPWDSWQNQSPVGVVRIQLISACHC